MDTKNESLIDKEGLRLDGRKTEELRPIEIKVGVLSKADGSAYFQQGKNKVLAGVYGPQELHPKHLARADQAVLRARYSMAPFSVDERKSPAPSRRDKELSKVIGEALESSLFLERYPRAGIEVFVEVLQADGGTRCACINAASLALADAGIPMRDLVVACAAGKVEDTIVLDLMGIEDKKGGADVPIALMPNFDAVTLLQMDGILNYKEFEYIVNLAIEGCREIYEKQKEALKGKYKKIQKEVEA